MADAADAQRLGFGGSPTILIDGRDLFPAPRVVDMACRLYASPDRRMAGAPSVGQLVEVLRQRLAPA